VSTLFSLESKR